MKEDKIFVNKPFLPPIEDYQNFVQEIFDRNWLTNHGPLVLRLEKELLGHLNVSYLQFVTNGTTALQLAIKALNLTGEVITTPFSYVATTSSLVWENCNPVFADIDPESFNIDHNKIEHLITDQTSAIVATHVFGNPCEVERIDEIAQKHNLKVIYDAAHAFSVEYKGKSILNYGDISTLSFHATKIYHSVEGGAVVTSSKELHDKVAYLKNFGHDGYEKFHGLGINGKNSEFHAAMGLCNIKYSDSCTDKYRILYELYRIKFKTLENIRLQKIQMNTTYNHAYFPVVFDSEVDMLRAKDRLEQQNIFPRRYFYPSLSQLPYVHKPNTPISESISSRILCLPLYYDLKESEVEKITTVVIETLSNE